MITTTNYGFNIVEGTDIVNPLTQLNPNFTTLDTDLKAVSDATIDAATCIKTGTVHAVTRTNTDAKVFRFTATGNWNAGDTMTVDGTLVSVFLPDGSAATDGCYVINTEVIAAIVGTRVTLYSNIANASNIEYQAGVSVQNALDTLNDEIIYVGPSAIEFNADAAFEVFSLRVKDANETRIRIDFNTTTNVIRVRLLLNGSLLYDKSAALS